jgi:ABC-2 type transport system permease protein
VKDILKVVWNEWRYLLRDKKVYGVVVVAILILCTFVTISYVENNEKKQASKTKDSLMYSDEMIRTEEEKLRNWNPNLDSYADQKRLVEQMKEANEKDAQLSEGNWREVIEERRTEATSHLEESDGIGRDGLIRNIEEFDFYLKHDVRPLGVYEMSAYDQVWHVNRQVVMLFIPLLVIALVTIIVFKKVPFSKEISRSQLLLGKWVASSSVAFIFSFLFYTVFWLMLSGLYGFSTGMFEPRWVNLGSVEEIAMKMDGTEEPFSMPTYEGATLIPNWLFTLYTALLSSVAMIFIATIAFACMLFFKKVVTGAIVASVIIAVGEVINVVIWEAERKMWLFTNHLNLMEHWASREGQPSILIGILVLGVWALLAIIPALYISKKRTISNE